MSDSVQPHRQQPTRLAHPWDSPGKNTGVGCHFLLQFMKVKSESEVHQQCPTLCNPMDCRLPGSSVHGILQARVLEWGAIAFSYYTILDTIKKRIRDCRHLKIKTLILLSISLIYNLLGYQSSLRCIFKIIKESLPGQYKNTLIILSCCFNI